MNKRGFILLEVILGIYLLGLVSIISLNLLQSTSIYFKKSEENMEIEYLGELVFENLKSKDEESIYFLDALSSYGDLEYPIPDNFQDRYICQVLLVEENEYLWCIKVRVYKNLDKGRSEYEEFQGSIPKKKRIYSGGACTWNVYN